MSHEQSGEKKMIDKFNVYEFGTEEVGYEDYVMARNIREAVEVLDKALGSDYVDEQVELGLNLRQLSEKELEEYRFHISEESTRTRSFKAELERRTKKKDVKADFFASCY